MGIPATPEEIKCHSWMHSALFGSGAEPLNCDIGTAVNVCPVVGYATHAIAF